MSVNKSVVDSVIKALYAYVNIDSENRRYLKRQLCTNNCIKYVLGNVINSSSARAEHETLFSVVTPKDFVELVSGTEENELFSAAEYIVEGLDIMKDVDEDKVAYLSKLFYKLSYVLLKFHLPQKENDKTAQSHIRGQSQGMAKLKETTRPNKHAVKSPPPPVRKSF